MLQKFSRQPNIKIKIKNKIVGKTLRTARLEVEQRVSDRLTVMSTEISEKLKDCGLMSWQIGNDVPGNGQRKLHLSFWSVDSSHD